MLEIPLDSDATCAECGYALRGRRIGSACPECGHAIATPMERDLAGEAQDARAAVGSALGTLGRAQLFWLVILAGASLCGAISVTIVGLTGSALLGGFILWGAWTIRAKGAAAGVRAPRTTLLVLRFLSAVLFAGGTLAALASLVRESILMPALNQAYLTAEFVSLVCCALAASVAVGIVPAGRHTALRVAAATGIALWILGALLQGIVMVRLNRSPGVMDGVTIALFWGTLTTFCAAALTSWRALGGLGALVEQDRLMPRLEADQGPSHLLRPLPPEAIRHTVADDAPIPLEEAREGRGITHIERSIHPKAPAPPPPQDDPDVY